MFRILAIKEIYSNPSQYGFILDSADYYPSIATYTVEVDSAIDNLAQYALDNGTNYKVLKLLNPWLRKPYLKNKAKKTYTITLPTDKNISIPADSDIKPAMPKAGDGGEESVE